MSDQVNSDPGIDDTQSPGFHFISSFQSMHDLNEKLILLDYGREFCVEYKCKPIHRYYFAVQTNPGEQFYTFSCLSAWLIKSKCKLDASSQLNPQEYEDPNVTIHGILDGLRSMGEDINFPPNRLKQGFGHEVIWVLNRFSDDALRKSEQSLRKTVAVRGLLEKDESEEVKTSDNEQDLEMNFEDQYTLVEEDGEDDGDGRGQLERLSTSLSYSDGIEKPKGFLVSQQDSEEWKLEIERVLPQLKVVLRTSDHKADWRIHVNQMHLHRKEIESHFENTQVSLETLNNETKRSVEKISSREKYLHLQLEPLINEYISLNGHLNQINENYTAVSSGVTEKSRQLAMITEELDAIKSEMEERGSSMTDGTPLVSLRKALNRVKTEISSIDIRIGVAVNTLLQVGASESTRESLERQKTPLLLNKGTLQKLVF